MKLRSEFERLLAAISIMDLSWAREFCDAARELKARGGYDQRTLYRAGIKALIAKLIGLTASAELTLRCALPLAMGKSATVTIADDEARDGVLCICVMWVGQTQARVARRLAGVAPWRVYQAMNELIEDGNLVLTKHEYSDYWQLFAMMPVPYRQISGPDGKVKFCGIVLSQRRLADHPANVHRLTQQAISKRLKSGMTPLEALITPRLRSGSDKQG